MRRPSTTIRNTRKHFVRCVDCNTQTLPQHASKERPWTTAAVLRIPGRNNEGALCFECGHKRRVLLGLHVEQDMEAAVRCNCDRPFAIGPTEAAQKNVRINKREQTWTVSTLDTLIAKWNHHYAHDQYKNRDMDLKKWVVFVNGQQIPSDQFNSVPITDGDEISITPGVLLHPF
jgi:sulfur carrier protein ThiS